MVTLIILISEKPNLMMWHLCHASLGHSFSLRNWCKGFSAIALSLLPTVYTALSTLAALRGCPCALLCPFILFLSGESNVLPLGDLCDY
jgi:hypothetical protein